MIAMDDTPTFSERHGYTLPEPEISIRQEAPEWLRHLVVQQAYEAGLSASTVRDIVCELLLEVPDRSNWSFPNVDGEIATLVSRAHWSQVYDLIELVYKAVDRAESNPMLAPSGERLDVLTTKLNGAFRRKGVGWQFVDGKIQVRGPEVFEHYIHEAVGLTTQTGREVARTELKEALRDLSRRPDPEITGAIQHAMAALECIAKDVTGDTKLTLGEWLKQNPASFPQPLSSAVEKLWGYASNYGRHVHEGKPAAYDEAEMVVGLVGALSVYLLRKSAK